MLVTSNLVTRTIKINMCKVIPKFAITNIFKYTTSLNSNNIIFIVTCLGFVLSGTLILKLFSVPIFYVFSSCIWFLFASVALFVFVVTLISFMVTNHLHLSIISPRVPCVFIPLCFSCLLSVIVSISL